MYLQYNGINLKVVQMVEWLRTSVYSEDNTAYLWTDHKVTVKAIYDGGQTNTYVAKKIANPNKIVIGINPNNFSPVSTDIAIRHKLSEPRGKLLIWESSALDIVPEEMIMECPLGAAKTDLNNGPHPLLHAIEEVRGSRTFVVTFSVAFSANENYAAPVDNQANSLNGSSPLIMANTWTSSLSYDENYNAVRMIKGEAVLRADLLKLYNLTADSFREKIIPAPGRNVKRFIDELTLHSDGHTYSYTVRDVQQAMEYIDVPADQSGNYLYNRDRRHVTSISGYVKRTAAQSGGRDVLKNALTTMRTALQGVSNVAGAVISAAGAVSALNPIGAIFAAKNIGFEGALGAFDTATAAYETQNSLLPEIQEEVVVIVQGSKYCRKSDLQYLAYSIAFGQLSGPATTVPFTIASAVRAVTGAVIKGDNTKINVPGNSGYLQGTVLPPASDGGLTPASGSVVSAPPTIGELEKQLGTFPSPVSALKGLASRVIPVANTVSLQYELMENKVTVMVTQSLSGLLDWVSNRSSYGINALTNPIPDTIVGGNWRGILASDGQESLNNTVATSSGSSYGKTRLADLPDTNLLIAAKNTGTSILPEQIVGGEDLLSLLAPKLFGTCELVPQPYEDDENKWYPQGTAEYQNANRNGPRKDDAYAPPVPNTQPPALFRPPGQ